MSFNNRERKPRVDEDVPEMRSMLVMPAASSAPMMIPRRAPIAKKAPGPVLSRTTMEQPKQAWLTDENAVDRLPAIYVLERSHAYVNDSVKNVTDRIAECLRKASLASNFDSNESIIEVDSKHCFKLYVRLWRSSDERLIVEVQKMDGCCVFFCRMAKMILRAAKGQSSPLRAPRQFKIPSSLPRQGTDESMKTSIKEGLEIAGDLAKRGQMDSQAMAVETLMHISKNTAMPCFAAQQILDGDLFPMIVNLIRDQDFSTREKYEVQQHSVMRRNALTVLSNCLSGLADENKLDSFLGSVSDVVTDSVLEAIVEDVAAAKTRPHDACEAARCLQPLMECTSTRRRLLDLGSVSDAVTHAMREGACRHALLEAECQKLQVQM